MIAKRSGNKRLSSLFSPRRASSSDVRLVSVGGSPNREFRRRRENLNSCASRELNAAQRRAVAARWSVPGDPSTRDAGRLPRIDVTARVSTRPRGAHLAADQILFATIRRESAPRNPLEADATDQRASCTAEVRPIPPRASPSGSLGDYRDVATVVLPVRSSRGRGRAPLARHVAGAIPGALEITSDISGDASFSLPSR